jgi:hypothetical protein
VPVEVEKCYLVEANMLKSDKGLLIALANWSGKKQSSVKITIHLDKRVSKIKSKTNKVTVMKRTAKKIILKVHNLNEGAFITCAYPPGCYPIKWVKK